MRHLCERAFGSFRKEQNAKKAVAKPGLLAELQGSPRTRPPSPPAPGRAGGSGGGAGGPPPEGKMGVHTRPSMLTPNPAAQAPRLLPPPLSFSPLIFFSHLREQMGLRGEAGQRWKQERKALLGLSSGQERVEHPVPQSPWTQL